MKQCYHCKSLYPLPDFSKDVSKNDGKSIYCRSCLRRKLKKNRDNFDYKVKRQASRYKYKQQEREYAIKYRYRLTVEQRDELFKKQNECCAICKTNQDTRGFSVDHCHKTGKIRGLLCNKCNTGLGMFGDNKENLKQAIEYLGDF